MSLASRVLDKLNESKISKDPKYQKWFKVLSKNPETGITSLGLIEKYANTLSKSELPGELSRLTKMRGNSLDLMVRVGALNSLISLYDI